MTMQSFHRCLVAACLVAGCRSARPAFVVAEPAAAPQASAQVRPGEPAPQASAIDAGSSLDELRGHAAEHNPGVQAAYERWQAALQRAPQTGALPDPRLSYRYFIEEVETRVGPQQQAVGVTQSLPWPGRLAGRGEVSQAEADASRARYRGQLAEALAMLDAAWCEAYYLERAIEAVRGNHALLSALEEVLRRRYASGESAYPDLLRAQVELDKLADRLRTLEDQRRPLTARLNAVLDRAPASPLPRPTSLRLGEPLASDARVTSWILEESPELEALAHEARREVGAAELARLERRPDLTLGLEWIDTGGARMPNVPDSGEDPWVVSLSLNLPVWGARLDAAEEQARAAQRAANLAREQAARGLEAAIEAALYSLRDAQRRAELYRETLLPRARQSFEAQEAAFRADAAPFLDLIDAERTLLEFELALERARTDQALALSRLERLAGRPLETLTSQPAQEDPR